MRDWLSENGEFCSAGERKRASKKRKRVSSVENETRAALTLQVRCIRGELQLTIRAASSVSGMPARFSSPSAGGKLENPEPHDTKQDYERAMC